ncbi:hypothetical protein [Mycoplasma phocoenae]|uniref:Uncharacterized protein n=1 Tax=Mycoplasma phocoenae TaxID=754517 RepID=A0A858U7Q0_9MOLU|nr:hypothetical protein [Mycoplasma phocoenae]QJG67243.1 hypothetical protein HGG69_02930 [Mycoplasma phocoenae]
MSDQKQHELKQKFINTISKVVGIIGLTYLDFDKEPIALDDDLDECIQIEVTNNKYVSIKLALILLSNVSVKKVMEELEQVITYTLKSEKYHLKTLDAFVRKVE